MKFLSLAVAAVAAFSGVAQAKEAFNKAEFKQELHHRMNNNMYNKDVLLKGAKPHSEAARDLEQNQNGFSLTSDYSIQFVQCFSLAVSYDALFENQNDNNAGYAMTLWKNGNAVAEQSYAIFKVCYTAQCDYTTDNDVSLEYVVDLATYIEALIAYLPEQLESYCKGCEENQETCIAQQTYGYGYGYGSRNGNGGSYGNNGGWNYGGNYNGYGYNGGGGGRKLAGVSDFAERVLNENSGVVKQLDCELCFQYSCISNNGNNNNNNNNNEYGFEAASEWLSSIAECYQTQGYYGSYGNQNNQNGNSGLYAGFMCNDDGTGVEIGMFFDEDCLLYLPNEPYTKYMSYYDQSYQEMTADIIEFTFDRATRFSCKDEEVSWTTQDLSAYGGEYHNYNYGNQDNNEVAEWCSNLYKNEAGTTPVDMYTCGARSGNNNNYQNYNQNNNNGGYSSMYSWYTYEISEDYALDMSSVCQAVKKSGDLHSFYNSENGNLYTYQHGSTGTEIVDETTSTQKSQRDLSAGEKFGIVALVGAVVGAVVAMTVRFRSASSDKKEPLIVGEQTTGEMA